LRRAAALTIACAVLFGAAASAHTREPSVPSDTVITLEREGCFGSCPSYRISVNALGAVFYEGLRNVRVEGTQVDVIPVGEVAALVAEAKRIGFFDLADRYTEIRLSNGQFTTVTDLPKAFLSISAGGRTKRVEDYLGTPPALVALERRVDVVTRSLRWTNIDELMIAELQRQGWMPTREELAKLLNRALMFDEVPVVEALLDSGADANEAPANESEPLLVARSAGATRALLAAGASPFLPSLVYHASYGDPGRVALLIKAGAPMDVSNEGTGLTPLMIAANAGNAGVVEVLLGAGANPAAFARGKSALDLARQSREAYQHMPWLPIPPNSIV
jgi:hypothetical protein